MRGPNPLPTSIKKARGNPGKRPLNDAEPETFAERPEPHEDLSGEALAEYHRICDDLERMGILSATDVASITIAARLWGVYMSSMREVDRLGTIVKTSSGGVVTSPHFNIATAAQRDLRAYYSEFGLTPASRSRVKVDTPKKKESSSIFDEWESLQGGA